MTHTINLTAKPESNKSDADWDILDSKCHAIGVAFCSVWDGENQDAEANAKLWAASEDFLVALERARQTINDLTVGFQMSDDVRTILGGELENIRAAIAPFVEATDE